MPHRKSFVLACAVALALGGLGCSTASAPKIPPIPDYKPGDQAQVQSLVDLCRDMPSETNVVWGIAHDPQRVQLEEDTGYCAIVRDHPHVTILARDQVYGQKAGDPTVPVLQVQVLDGQHAGKTGYITAVSTVPI